MSTPNTPVRPPRVLTRSFPLYLPHLPNAIRVATGLCFVMQTYPCVRPYMRFLFVRPEFCPLRDLSTPKIRLSSDSASRRTPLPLASPSRYRADSGLSPYRTCAHRAHTNVEEDRSVLLHFLAALHNSARAFGERFLSRQGLKSAGILCVPARGMPHP